MKIYFKVLLIIFFSIESVAAQTKREGNMAQERTRNWQYESICAESGGTESSYLIQVTSYVPDLKLALPQAKKNAIHAVLFKGVSGNNLGCTTKDPLVSDSNYQTNFDYFEDFFFNTSQYNKYATAPSGSAESSETYKVKGKKNFRVTFILSVNVDELREKLEFDKIIQTLGIAEGAGAKPSIMIFPSDSWMEKNGYFTMVDNQGVETFVPDYATAVRDDRLNIAIRTLDGMINERGYSTTRLEETMKSISQGSAIDNLNSGRDGGMGESNPVEDILNTAKADIIWKVFWKKDGNGIQNWIEYGIEALDAYTNKAFAVEDGSGPKSMSAGEGDLIRQAVTDKMDAFLSEHQKYFNKLSEVGREIVLEIRRWDSFEYYFNDDVEFADETYLFSELLEFYISTLSKDTNFSFNPSENKIDVSGMRIDLVQEKINPLTKKVTTRPVEAKDIANKISKWIKSEFDYDSQVINYGLGKARITIGEK
tara:strand:+ start:2961 stop:4403 length:1443 start_codon:yes stop_codon:yes gene_type:complete